jgi:signal transduction histidine kinase
MKTKPALLVYWFLLILPALFIGIRVLTLLSHEKERLRIQTVASLTERAKTMAENLELTVTDVEEAFTRSLFDLDENRAESVLRSWQESNPLVRNVFVWRDNRLLYPSTGLAATPEERRFKTRYEALFTGRMAFDFGSGVSSEEWDGLSRPNAAVPEKTESAFSSVRKELVDLARPGRKMESAAPSEMPSGKKPFARKSGWIPWFFENRLFILGYVQKEEKGPVYGLELELMTLLSRMVVQIPRTDEHYAAFGLVSEEGQLVHQTGGFPIDVKKQPDISVPLSGILPHYRMNAYFSEKGLPGGSGFVTVSALLAVLFTGAVILGGALLIRESRRNMKDAMEKTSFVSSVSHELKTPLTSIRMYAELLSEGRVTDPSKVRHYLSVIVGESQRLTRLVNNVLDFGRLEQGRKTYHKTSFDAADFVRSLLDVHGIRIAGAGLDLGLDLPDHPVPLETDRDALEQVMLNILDNAVKYAHSGGYLGISLKAGTAGRIDISIEDRGPGIPKDHREKVFEKFHRVDNSLTAEKAGSGLGLSIARRIMRDLGGDVVYEPCKDGGSRFIVMIR